MSDRTTAGDETEAKPTAETDGRAAGVPYGERGELPPPRAARDRGLLESLGRSPFLNLLVYYVVVVGVTVLLAAFVPAVREAFLSPVPTSDGAGLLTGRAELPPDQAATTAAEALHRALITFIVSVGALLIVIPVARVYMYTKRLRYDPALVRSVIILPIVVAGITVVVKNSIALAFSLAGIVAAVRFRNTLKDPRDAVYIFLAISIGLAAGVQALDVALVTSAAFNLLVLSLWQFNVGSIYGGRYGRTGVLATGAPELYVAQNRDLRRQIRSTLVDDANDDKIDGILLVHARDTEMARHTVQEALGEMAKDWRLVRIVPRDDAIATLHYLLRLKKKTTAPELVGALDERWATHIAAAEYLPFRMRRDDND